MLSQEHDAGPSRPKPAATTEDGTNNMLGASRQEEEAAVTIQRHYRGYRSRQRHPKAQL